MNVIIPLAGKDKNFEKLGNVKPLTLVNGKPLIEQISYSRPFPYKEAIFILLKEHQKSCNIDKELIRIFGNKIKIVWADKITDGAPQSILLAEEYIDNNEELLIDLADQYLDLTGFMEFINKNNGNCDGIIPSFQSYYWNRGYMMVDGNNYVKKVSEKDRTPISTHSTACVSYFKRGSDFVKYAKKMIEKKEVAANGAYLVSLAYNEMIEDGKKILSCPVEFIAPLGTVEGVRCFEQLDRPLKWKS